MAGDMTVSEGFAISAFAEVIGVAREKALTTFLQIKSFFQANRTAYEIARARVTDGTPPTTKEALTNLAIGIGGFMGFQAFAAGSIAFQSFGLAAAAALGCATTGIAPFLLGLGLAIICAVLVMEAGLTVFSFLKGVIDGLAQKAALVTS
jgi:hypothetical protein